MKYETLGDGRNIRIYAYGSCFGHQNWRRGVGLNRKTLYFASVPTNCYGCEPMLKVTFTDKREHERGRQTTVATIKDIDRSQTHGT